MSNDKMTTADAQAMIEEMLEFERNPVTESQDVELTEDAAQSAFDHEVKPWLRRELEKVMGQLDKKMQGIMRGQFPEKRMEYGITRYAPMSMGPKDFLKSLRIPYRYWRGQIRGMVEGVESGGDELTEDYKRPILDAIGRLESDLTDMKQAVNQGKLEDASLIAANIVSHAGDVAMYFWIVAKKQGFTGAPLKRFENYMNRFKVMKPATH